MGERNGLQKKQLNKIFSICQNEEIINLNQIIYSLTENALQICQFARYSSLFQSEEELKEEDNKKIKELK
jgi:hypothetical protein